MITTYLIDTKLNKAFKHTHFIETSKAPYLIENRLKVRKINGTEFTFIEIDDRKQLSAFSFKDNWDRLTGSVMITKYDGAKEVGLNEKELDLIIDHTKYYTNANGIPIPILMYD